MFNWIQGFYWPIFRCTGRIGLLVVHTVVPQSSTRYCFVTFGVRSLSEIYSSLIVIVIVSVVDKTYVGLFPINPYLKHIIDIYRYTWVYCFAPSFIPIISKNSCKNVNRKMIFYFFNCIILCTIIHKHFKIKA